jgi:hypothetical protein
MRSKEDAGDVLALNYGLLAPLNWGRDVDDELYRMNALWNKCVEIERANRERYLQIVAEAPAMADLQKVISALQDEREQLIRERNRRRALTRSKAKADTADITDRLAQIKIMLTPLYEHAKAVAAAAREEQKPLLDALEAERKAAVKLARQQSGCYWPNYNAVLDSYANARQKAIKDRGELRFRSFRHDGRLVNQIQGGMTTEDLFGCKHSQAGIRITDDGGECTKGMLYVTAYTGRDSDGRHTRRTVEFPIILHRPIPPDATIKSVAVSIR